MVVVVAAVSNPRPVADTAFMYVLAVLSMVKIYQSRHPDINARAHATFAVLAVLIALGNGKHTQTHTYTHTLQSTNTQYQVVV